MILSIERSSAVASAALFSHDGVCVAACSNATLGAGDAYPLVSRLLSEASVATSTIDAFVIGTGPGSFSGIRSAIALAAGLALPARAPVVGISSAAARAYHYRQQNPQAAPIKVLGDARRGHIWCLDEPSDFKTLSHSPKDFRLLSASGASDVDMPPLSSILDGGYTLLLADPARLAPYVPAGIACDVNAEDIARLYFLGASGAADPVYMHPAVVGRIASTV